MTSPGDNGPADCAPEMRDRLLSEILGSFDLISSTAIFPTRCASADLVSSTYVHEEGHRRLLFTTTFGTMQWVLARICDAPSSSSVPAWASNARPLLSLSISRSWYTHEGFAVYREAHYANLSGRPFDDATLPPEYARAYSNALAVAKSIPRVLSFLSWHIVRAVFELAANIPLAPVGLCAELLTSCEGILRRPELVPDFRLRAICDELPNVDWSADSRIVLDRLAVVRHEYGISIDEPWSDVVRRCAESVDDRSRQIATALGRIADDLVFRLISARIADRFPVMSISEVETAFCAFVSRLRADREPWIDIPEVHVTEPYAGASALNDDQVEYINDCRLEVVAQTENYRNHRFAELETPEWKYAISIGRARARAELRKAVGLTHYCWLDVIPLVAASRDEIQHIDDPQMRGSREVLRLVGARYATYGSASFVREVLRGCASRVTLVGMEFGMCLPDFSGLSRVGCKLLSDVPGRAVMIFPSTKSHNVRAMLCRARDAGIDHLYLLRENDYLHYVLIPGKVPLLIRVTKILQGIMRVHFESEWNWFLTALGRPPASKESVQLAADAKGLAGLIELGGIATPAK